MPPAFALSQDQTLKFIRSNTSSPAIPLRTARPNTSELRHHSLKSTPQFSQGRPQPCRLLSLTPSPGQRPVPRSTSRLPGTQPAHRLRQNASHASFPQERHHKGPQPPQQQTPGSSTQPAPTYTTPVIHQITQSSTQVPSLVSQFNPSITHRSSTIKPLCNCQGAIPEHSRQNIHPSMPLSRGIPSSEHPTCRQE